MADKLNIAEKSQKGFTLIEVMLGMMVIIFSMVGLVQAFIYGNAYVEKFGFKRQAMIILDAEIENMMAFKRATGQLDDIGQLYEELGRSVDFGRGGVQGTLEVGVESAQYDRGLKYWEVHAMLQYGNGLFQDTAILASRFYKEGAN